MRDQEQATAMLARWRAALPATTTPDLGAAAGADLLRRWQQPHRRYHTAAHLAAVLEIIDDHAGLAADPEHDDRYAHQIRQEYRHVTDAAFAAARTALLHRLADDPSLYRILPDRAVRRSRARQNMLRELDGLRHPRSGQDIPAANSAFHRVTEASGRHSMTGATRTAARKSHAVVPMTGNQDFGMPRLQIPR